ncbi:FAD-dependent monooxygenase [Nonomuraea rubra]|uniref:FAD-dependent monooxygenase n=1 Tax=Nonomuraea rubra TaxID=46180 RepID=UPI0033C2042F
MVGHGLSWSAPGVLLLGDAAHPMSPVRAQGINLALRDVVVAANHLLTLAEEPTTDSVEQACRAIQAEREPEVSRAQRLQRREAQGRGTPAPRAGATPWPSAAPACWAAMTGRGGPGCNASTTCVSARRPSECTPPHLGPDLRSGWQARCGRRTVMDIG